MYEAALLMTLLYLPHPLGQLVFSELQKIHHSLFTKIHSFDISNVLRRWPTDSAGHNDRIDLQHDTVINNLVDSE